MTTLRDLSGTLGKPWQSYPDLFKIALSQLCVLVVIAGLLWELGFSGPKWLSCPWDDTFLHITLANLHAHCKMLEVRAVSSRDSVVPCFSFHLSSAWKVVFWFCDWPGAVCSPTLLPRMLATLIVQFAWSWGLTELVVGRFLDLAAQALKLSDDVPVVHH